MFDGGFDPGARDSSEQQPLRRRAGGEGHKPGRVPVDDLVVVTRALDYGIHVAQLRLVELAERRAVRS